MRSLFKNRCFLVIRPHGKALCARIEALGGEAVHFPTIEFESFSDTPAFAAAMSLLAEQDYLIFISPQAVLESAAFIKQYDGKLAAIGGGTAQALESFGLKDIIYPENQWTSEGLLAHPEFQTITGKKIAIIRGEGGRGLLDQVFLHRGAKILQIIPYKRILPKIDAAHLAFIAHKKIDTIIGSSLDTVRHLKILCDAALWDKIKAVPLIVMSERVKLLAHALGFQTILVVHANDESVLALLRNTKGKP